MFLCCKELRPQESLHCLTVSWGMTTLQYWYAREMNASKQATSFLGSKNTLPVLLGNLTGTAIFQGNAPGNTNTHTAQWHFFWESKSVSKESPYISLSPWAMVLSAQVPRETCFHYHAPEISWTKEWQKRMRRPNSFAQQRITANNTIIRLASVYMGFFQWWRYCIFHRQSSSV